MIKNISLFLLANFCFVSTIKSAEHKASREAMALINELDGYMADNFAQRQKEIQNIISDRYRLQLEFPEYKSRNFTNLSLGLVKNNTTKSFINAVDVAEKMLDLKALDALAVIGKDMRACPLNAISMVDSGQEKTPLIQETPWTNNEKIEKIRSKIETEINNEKINLIVEKAERVEVLRKPFYIGLILFSVGTFGYYFSATKEQASNTLWLAGMGGALNLFSAWRLSKINRTTKPDDNDARISLLLKKYGAKHK